MRNSRLAFDPQAQRALLKGFNKLASAMIVALGPRGRTVAVNRDNSRRPPELLNDGAAIARRFTGFPSRFETMGAFMARHIAWQVEEAVGDGATTAVVIAQAILNEANRYVAAGFNAMRIRRGMEKALVTALAELERQGQPLGKLEQIRSLATSITGDETIGQYTEEIFDIVGAYGAVQVRTHYGRGHDRRFINGTFWNQGWASSYFTTEGGTAIVKDPYLLLTNRHLNSADELLPVLELVRQTGEGRGLVVIAPTIAGGALNLLVTNKTRGSMSTLGIKAPGLGPEKAEVLTDLAILTGGRVFYAEADDRIEKATLADLGQAREVQAIRSGFTLIGGKGRPAAIRQRAQELRSRLPDAPYGRERNRLVERAGKLQGGVALLEVGGATETERDYLKERTEEAVHVVRLGMQGGVAPGGGVAYLACVPAVCALQLSDEEAPGAAILAHALAAPMRAILENSGVEATAILAHLHSAGPGCGYDVMRLQFTDMMAANIIDPVKVLQVALQTGVSGALMALTTDVLVHKPRSNRNEEVDFRP
ncbi:MAG: chaperonin GroEL [Caldilineaceae bacterium]|nr:chaperonin GroEL [Caldilineaceae bacterium]